MDEKFRSIPPYAAAPYTTAPVVGTTTGPLAPPPGFVQPAVPAGYVHPGRMPTPHQYKHAYKHNNKSYKHAYKANKKAHKRAYKAQKKAYKRAYKH